MVVDAVVRTQAQGRLSLRAALLLIPALFLLLGLVLRYMAYAAIVPEPSLAGFADGLCRWDCGWYVRIAETGYDPFPVPKMINAGNWAFFPLFPMLVGGLRALTGLPTMIVATATSLLMAYGAVVLSWQLLAPNLRAYALYSAFILAGPFSMYFTTFYTEVAFVFLTIGVFVALKKQNYLLAGVLAALLSATRIVGVFIVFAIVIQAFYDHKARGGTIRDFIAFALGRPDLVLAVFIAPMGLFCYMLFLHLQVGDALAFSHVQRAWGRTTGNPLGFLWQGLTNMPQSGFVPNVSQQLALAAIVGLFLAGWLAFKRHYAAAVFCAICILLPMGAGLASMLRFVTALAPLMLAAMTLLARNRFVFAASVLVFLATDYFFAIGWITGYLSLV